MKNKVAFEIWITVIRFGTNYFLLWSRINWLRKLAEIKYTFCHDNYIVLSLSVDKYMLYLTSAVGKRGNFINAIHVSVSTFNNSILSMLVQVKKYKSALARPMLVSICTHSVLTALLYRYFCKPKWLFVFKSFLNYWYKINGWA